jgi:hypothetical protein
VFHVELRQFPHVARAFNLSREEIDERLLRPLAAGRPLRWDDRSWSPDKLKVSIYEGPELAVEEIGMGRGWGNVTKRGEDVTVALLAEARAELEKPPALEELKQAILAGCAGQALRYEQLLTLAAEVADDADANQAVGLTERAVWELVREGRLSVAATALGG